MSHIEKISSDDSLLLAYAAGELEGEDLEQCQKRLSADPALKERATQVQADYQWLMRTLDQLNTDDRAQQTALAQTHQLMRQWHGVPRVVAANAQAKQWHPRRWVYAAAAAVAIFAGISFWVANGPPDATYLPGPNVQAPETVAVSPNANPEQSAEDEPVRLPLAFQSFSSDEPDNLADLERETVALSQDPWSASNDSGNMNQ